MTRNTLAWFTLVVALSFVVKCHDDPELSNDDPVFVDRPFEVAISPLERSILNGTYDAGIKR